MRGDVSWVVLSGKGERAAEAQASVNAMRGDSVDRQVIVRDFADGFFPCVQPQSDAGVTQTKAPPAAILASSDAEIGLEAYALPDRLFQPCRSLSGGGVRASFDVLEEYIPLTHSEVPSGTRVRDWTSPPQAASTGPSRGPSIY